MSKVTSKLQVTIPKAVADHYGIRPGDEVRWEVREGGPLMAPEKSLRDRPPVEERTARFLESVARVARLQEASEIAPGGGRGWTRDDLYGERLDLPR